MRVPKDRPPGPGRFVAAALFVAAGGAALWAAGVGPGSPRGADPDRLWRAAQDDFRAGAYGKAEAALNRLARLRAPTPLDWVLKAQLAMARDRNDEALRDLARVPPAHPMGPQARLIAGQIELRRSRLRFAEARLREAVGLDPKLVQAHRELVFVYGILLRRPELHAEFRALAGLTAMTFDNVFHWCLTRNTVWEPKELAGVLRRYVDADPGDRWSRLALAECLRQVGRRAEAEKALAVLPDADPDARVVRVRLALDRGDAATAEALLAEGPEGHPELARLRGRVALARRDGPAAVRHFRAAYAAEPDHRDTIFGLGQALAMAGKADEAAPFQTLARDYDAFGTLLQRASTPKARRDPDLLRALGAACEKVRRYSEARAWYGLAIDANPLDTEAQKALFRLKGRDPAGEAAGGRP